MKEIGSPRTLNLQEFSRARAKVKVAQPMGSVDLATPYLSIPPTLYYKFARKMVLTAAAICREAQHHSKTTRDALRDRTARASSKK